MRLIVEELQLLLVKDLPLKFCGLPAHGKGKDGVCISLIHSNERMAWVNLVSWPLSLLYRFKKTESTLRDIAASFRVYADGLNFSSDLMQYDDE